MSRTLSLLAAGVLLLALGACASNSSAAGDATLSILEPASGAVVSAPFFVRVKTAQPLGTAESGNHHLYLWFDGDEAKHQIAYADTIEVTKVPDGEHKLTVSLRNPDHSDAGPRVSISLTIGDSGVPSY